MSIMQGLSFVAVDRLRHVRQRLRQQAGGLESPITQLAAANAVIGTIDAGRKGYRGWHWRRADRGTMEFLGPVAREQLWSVACPEIKIPR